MKQLSIGYEVEGTTLDSLLAKIDGSLANGARDCRWIACLNVYSYAVAQKDPSFERALHDADWLVPDGVGIVWASRLFQREVVTQITGFEIFEGVMQILNRTGGSVFFLGSTEMTLDLIAEKLAVDYPNINLAGTYSPPFKLDFSPKDTDDMISKINSSQADVLWVGMTAPKQEKWISQNKDRLPVSMAGAIGAVFDFYSGQVNRSHPVFQKLGLEWVHRFASQPGRHWRRTITIPAFMCQMLLRRMGFHK